jgi:cytosine/adenosine deaminase-related metal-dependent hydrolase
MIITANAVVTMEGPPILSGAVVVEGDRIVAVGPRDEILREHHEEPRELGQAVLIPGLVNAHCHLDYTEFAGEVPLQRTFTEWLGAIVARKELKTPQDFARGVEKGLKRSLETGTTTVANVESCFEVLDLLDLDAIPQRVWWFLELIDVGQNVSAQELLDRAMTQIAKHRKTHHGFGLSPHAPYSASDALYRRAAQLARNYGWPLMTHVAETTEEDQMFRQGQGPMYDFFQRLGRNMSDCRHGNPFEVLGQRGIFGENCIAVHVNVFTPQDLQWLAKTKTSLVHCPKSNEFFRRGVPPLVGWQQAGLNICLGTDSMASNDDLDMFAEMRLLAEYYPELPAEELLAMATKNPAKALGAADEIGSIAVGKSADLIAVEMPTRDEEPTAAAILGGGSVIFRMIRGKIYE